MNNNKWIDISQPLTNSIAHWPEDTPFTNQLTYSKEQTGSVNIGQMTTSLHIGTHVDAPYHFDNKGKKIIDMDVNYYIGRAKVIDVSDVDVIDGRVLEDFSLDGVERLLLKTSLKSRPELFPEKITKLEPEIVPILVEKGVKLLGVNMPSVDPIDSKDLLCHHALHQHGIYILENLVLDDVPEGDYNLIALPLAIAEGDGSPVRAVIQPTD
ncbi:arylformamidase [Aquibacillus halophilus]|uniref:Kynurenine formamidase n=1 Tax=Aquibacillus halophilus TaxID=930132 RepID=A0A6A8DFW0_9BACI|nr:arylformamidase [Aquibacillus halophilus]MRH42739.1 arylformamidase [Aquibacillus halophilus]